MHAALTVTIIRPGESEDHNDWLTRLLEEAALIKRWEAVGG